MDIVINATTESDPEGCEKLGASGTAVGVASAQVGVVIGQRNYYVNLLTCLGYSADSPPVADLLRKLHGLDGEWWVLSPIHWQATHNDAMIVACDAQLQLSDDESRQWFNELTEFLAQDGVKLHYHDAYTWLIQFKRVVSFDAKPVSALLQQSILPHLKALDRTSFGQRFITENQMFFSQHGLNKTRLNRYAINGIWIWGGGVLTSVSLKSVIAMDEAAFNLASIVSTKVSRYQIGKTIAKDAVILSSTKSFDRESLKKRTVHWYWNNMMYSTKRTNWFMNLLTIRRKKREY